MTDTPALSIVVPVFDEAENILPLISETEAALSGAGLAYEIVYVDDGSGDETRQRLAEAQARCVRLRIVRLRRRCGQSAAIVAGIGQARGPLIATLDGDGQNDPADIPRLLDALPAGVAPAPLVAGVRRNRQDDRMRRFSSSIANRFAKLDLERRRSGHRLLSQTLRASDVLAPAGL